MKVKSSRNGKIILSFTDIGKSCPSREFLASQICLLNTIRKNKVLTKISGFTVLACYTQAVTFLVCFYIQPDCKPRDRLSCDISHI